MKKIFITISCLFLISCTSTTMKELEVKNKLLYKKGSSKLYSGILKSYHENGKVKTVNDVRNGQIYGIQKVYYETGELESEISIKDGDFDVITTYYKNGNVNTVFDTKNILNSSKTYYENGALKSEIKDFECFLYYKSGHLKAKYDLGIESNILSLKLRNGKYMEYYDFTGRIKSERIYNGVHIFVKNYSDNGDLIQVINENSETHEKDVKNYNKHGILTAHVFFKNNIAFKVKKYKDGYLEAEFLGKVNPYNGTMKIYNSLGKIVEQIVYSDGKVVKVRRF